MHGRKTTKHVINEVMDIECVTRCIDNHQLLGFSKTKPVKERFSYEANIKKLKSLKYGCLPL